MSRARPTQIVVPTKPRRQPPRLDARRRETPGPHRRGWSEPWRRALGERFHSSRDPGARGTTEGSVLIVDDESSIRLICRLNLRSAGFDTLEASDGASAIALARAERPDLILLDVMLPDLDGWRVADELAENDETREIPILFLSARSESGDQRRGHATGGVGYITKPFDPLAMTNTVRDVLLRVRRGERDAMRGEWERLIGAE
ncbi:MAG TPA: response regulator [Gaiellaceae bacterium]|nr:response regulator [Gaiellaceae bacterium]